METIRIHAEAMAIYSNSSKGDQSKWRVGNKWVKKNARGYENEAEYAASLILNSSTLLSTQYISYYPCIIKEPNGDVSKGCYSFDFRGKSKKLLLKDYLKLMWMDDVIASVDLKPKDGDSPYVIN